MNVLLGLLPVGGVGRLAAEDGEVSPGEVSPGPGDELVRLLAELEWKI